MKNPFLINYLYVLQDLISQELRSQMLTFVQPQRLPVLVKSKNVCNKEMKTDDSQREHFTHQFHSMKSVELNAKV